MPLDDSIKNSIISLSRSASDATLKKNASAAANAGLEVRVTRTYDGVGLNHGKDRCQWCLDRCGENMTIEEAYRIGAFQRHDGCGCVIEYTSKKGLKTIQTGKYSGWNFNDELEKRKSIGLDEKFFADELFSRFSEFTEMPSNDIYETARAGGPHAGMYHQALEKPKKQLENSIRSHIRQVEEHTWKMLHPEKVMVRGDPNDPDAVACARGKWRSDRKRNAQQAAIELEVWRRLYGA